jgi:hypothetical protein
MKNFASMKVERFELKPGTKTVWLSVKTKNTELSETDYNRVVDASPFFRRLGGSETHTKNYTSRGYKTVQIVSKSPCRTLKTVRTFEFTR